ncbi:15411_t:CDS:10, partial [Dentiscutata erythropus]
KTRAARTIDTFGDSNDDINVANYVPRTINVVDFAEARAFEINAMNDALERARQTRNTNVIQYLPRHLRRRAASHNVKRLPARLRKQAAEEIVKSTKKPNRRKKRRPGSLADEYKRRQGTKRWLETHIWHAKRMKMIELWGHKLAEYPNEKSIKSSYRASQHLSIIHDASYFGWIQISGDQNVIIKLLNSVTDPSLPSIGSERYLNGKRQCSTFLYHYLMYPTHVVAPINLIWRPASVIDTSAENNKVTRHVLIWVHGCAFDEVFETLEIAIEKMELQSEISISNLQDEFLIFELTGPRSTALLQEVLDIADVASGSNTESSLDINTSVNIDTEIREVKKTCINSEAHKTWATLRDLRSSASLPPGVVLGLTVFDPRLRFPKKVPPRTSQISPSSSTALQRLLLSWPNNVANCDIWDEKCRNHLKTNKIKDGQRLIPTPIDSLIPILLIQRDGLITTSNKSDNDVDSKRDLKNNVASSEYNCGWNLIMPSGWGMDFWKSFVFAGAWVGGLRERHSNHFESGMQCFPYDFPSTRSYNLYSKQQKEKHEQEYLKKPPAKRVNYKKLQVNSPFEPGFEALMGIKPTKDGSNITSGDVDKEKDDIKETKEIIEGDIDNMDEGKMTDDKPLSRTQYNKLVAEQKLWLLRGAKNIKLLQRYCLSTHPDSVEGLWAELQTQIKESFAKRGISLLPEASGCFSLEKALVNVRINLLARGCPKWNAIIYKVGNKNTYQKWERKIRKSDDYKEYLDDEINDKEVPCADDIIGYIITGQFSFSQGHGFGIGCCSVTKCLEMIKFERRYI